MEPEPESVEGEMEGVDVAEMMGFSSFGRKRKHADSPLASRPALAPQSAHHSDPQHPAGAPAAMPPSLPVKPPPAGAGEHRAPASAANRHQGRMWWVGYYDPTSNENPWEILEKREGLQPLGPWLPRSHARGEQRRGAEGAREAPGDAPGQGPAEGGE